jgi:hypothetical protein
MSPESPKLRAASVSCREIARTVSVNARTARRSVAKPGLARPQVLHNQRCVEACRARGESMTFCHSLVKQIPGSLVLRYPLGPRNPFFQRRGYLLFEVVERPIPVARVCHNNRQVGLQVVRFGANL